MTQRISHEREAPLEPLGARGGAAGGDGVKLILSGEIDLVGRQIPMRKEMRHAFADP